MVRIVGMVAVAFVLGSCGGTNSSNDGGGDTTDVTTDGMDAETGGTDAATGTPDAATGTTDYEWAAWPIPPESPVDYTCSDDTCTDNVTGLVWQRAVPSQSYTWDEAKAYCQGLSLGGFSSGWRLPTEIELVMIVDLTVSGPAINRTAFPYTPGGVYWSSSPYVYGGYPAWGVDFSGGGTKLDAASRVRCVYSGGANGTSGQIGAPAGQYTVATDTVSDNRTGLVWQRCTAGLSGSSCATGSASIFTDAATYCQDLSLGGFSSGWRLPTVKELQSIVNRRTVVPPAIDQVAFPSTPSNWVWSSSAYAGDSPHGIWGVNFYDGSESSVHAAQGFDYGGMARCVR